MSGDGNDRGGVKAPRTLFSLGRPGAKRPREGGEGTTAVETDDVAVDEVPEEMEIQYACGACGALLPSGAGFCGECGTPVAMDDDEYDSDGMLDELVGTDEAEATTAPAAESVAPPAVEIADEPPADIEAEAPTETTESDSNGAGSALAAGAVGAAAGGAILDSQRGTAAPEAPADAAGAVAGQDLPSVPGQTGGQGPGQSGADQTAYSVPGQSGGQAAAFDANTTGDLAPPLDLSGGAPPAEPGAPTVEPAAVLYADPSMAEPLPPKTEGWGVSEPMVGNVQDDVTEVVPESDRSTIGPAGAALAGGAVGAAAGMAAADAATTTDLSSAAAAAPPAADAPTSWTVAPEGGAAAGGEVNVPPGLVGTTAQSMPYGAGPVESSETGNKVLLIAAVIVVAILVLGGLAFALTRGGGSDVATSQASTTTAAAKKQDNVAKPGDSPTSTAASSQTSTTAASASSETTAAPASTDTTAPATETSQSTATTATTAKSTVTQPTTQITSPQTQPTTQQTTVQPAQINFLGQPSYRIGKGGSASFNVTNVGGSAGDFQCSGNGIQVAPPNGSVNPGGSQNVVIQDFKNAGARYSISCVGAGGGRFSAEVVVD